MSVEVVGGIIGKEDGTEKASYEMRTGICFNRTTNEIMSVTDADDHPGPQWQHVTGETRLGLLAIRKLLVERGLVDDATVVYWYMPQLGSGLRQRIEEISGELEALREQRHERGGRQDGKDRLVERFLSACTAAALTTQWHHWVASDPDRFPRRR